MTSVFTDLWKNKFLKSVGAVSGGNIAGQGLALLALPILTELYSVQEFDALAVYIASVTILATIAGLRYEVAIPLPHNDKDAKSLLLVSGISCLFTSLLLLLLILLTPINVFNFLGEKSATWIPLIPLGVASLSLYTAFQFWALRKKQFGKLATFRIFQVTGGLSVQIFCGFIGVYGGLYYGHILISLIGVFLLAFSFFSGSSLRNLKVFFSNVRCVAKTYADYPKFSIIEGLATTSSMQLPIIIIASLSQGPEAGYLFLAMRVLGTPIELITGSIAQVYFSEGSEQYRKQKLRSFTMSLVTKLAILGAPFAALIYLFAEHFFVMAFGEEWHRAGEIASLLSLMYFFRFITAAISPIMNITRALRTMMLIKILNFVIRCGSVLAAYFLIDGFLVESYIYASSFSLFLVFLVCIRQAVACNDIE